MTPILTILLCPLAALNLFFVVELLSGLRSSRSEPGNVGRSTAVVIVPAHDEQRIIDHTLRSLTAAASESVRILVVADNCSDSTAEIARSYGVAVTERFDGARRGKGFALDHARIELRACPPDCVVVVDADCTIDGASLTALIDNCLASGRPGQAIYLLQPDRDAPPLVQISNFAFFLKNSVRQRGLQRLAGRVHLTGTGMAFPWAVFDSAPLATASIVEDLQLGIHLSEGGHLPQLVPHATVWSAAAGEAETMVQRRRWEGGFLATAFRAAPGVLLRSVRRGDLRGVWAALDLFVPPVALLVIGNVFTVLAGAALRMAGLVGSLPLMMTATSFAAVGAAVMLAWVKGGRPFLSFRALMRAPVYVIRKLALYGRLLRHGAPVEWQRTGRK